MTTLFTRARSLVLSMIGFIDSLRTQPHEPAAPVDEWLSGSLAAALLVAALILAGAVTFTAPAHAQMMYAQD